MGWFRFDDKAIDHPKFLALSDGAFRLWIEGGTYCNRHLTDGLILRSALNGFRYSTRKRIDELVAQRLWEADGDSFRLHDYHQWNDSKEEVLAKKEASLARLHKHRVKRVSEPVSNALRNAHSPSGVGSISSQIEKRKDPFVDESVTERAGRFIDRYEALYFQHRNARYLVRPQRDYTSEVEVCNTWTDDARLDKLAAIFLTTDHQFAASGARNITQFASMASWCDGQLSAWESKNGGANGSH